MTAQPPATVPLTAITDFLPGGVLDIAGSARVCVAVSAPVISAPASRGNLCMIERYVGVIHFDGHRIAGAWHSEQSASRTQLGLYDEIGAIRPCRIIVSAPITRPIGATQGVQLAGRL